MRSYTKYYADYYGISWDHAKLEVHHINGNRRDNDIDNLILLPKELHRRLHRCGWFDLTRYETQMLQIGMSDQRHEDLEARVSVIEECRKWAILRAVNYKQPSGESLGEITEETEL